MNALVELLDDIAEVHTWRVDTFRPSQMALQSLLREADEADFAAMVLSGDDSTLKRGKDRLSVRDNVLLETGIFIGAIGMERTFLLHDEFNRPELPTDLDGINLVSYSLDGMNPHGGILDRMNRPQAQIRRRIGELGARRSLSRRAPQVYWCGPHHNYVRNDEAATTLRALGIDVYVPGRLVPDENTLDLRTRAEVVRSACSKAIRTSDVVVVDLDNYGLDSAWEIGYAEALGIRVIGYSRSDAAIDQARVINRRVFDDNFMHGWDKHTFSSDLDDLIPLCRAKSVHVTGSFAGTPAMNMLRESRLATEASRLVFPIDMVNPGSTDPADYSWRARSEAVRLVRECDISLAILPRYGMDSSWQLGYAYGYGKTTIGWVSEDSTAQRQAYTLFEHWMHGWRQKLWMTDLLDVAAFVSGRTRQSQRKLSVPDSGSMTVRGIDD